MKVPSELSHPLFFPDGYFLWKESDSHRFQASRPFVYEASFYKGKSSLKPWENPQIYKELLLMEFEKVKAGLESKFKQRDSGNVLNSMRHLIGLFLEFLFWSNQLPVSFPLDKLGKLTCKPINVEERLQFILSRPTMYHSYVQLIELMSEQEKAFSKAELMNQLNKTKSVRK